MTAIKMMIEAKSNPSSRNNCFYDASAYISPNGDHYNCYAKQGACDSLYFVSQAIKMRSISLTHLVGNEGNSGVRAGSDTNSVVLYSCTTELCASSVRE